MYVGDTMAQEIALFVGRPSKATKASPVGFDLCIEPTPSLSSDWIAKPLSLVLVLVLLLDCSSTWTTSGRKSSLLRFLGRPICFCGE